MNFIHYPINYGYIIERIPERDEILFHYKFLNLFHDYNKYLLAQNIDGTTMPAQKEITILQPAEPLQLKQIF